MSKRKPLPLEDARWVPLPEAHAARVKQTYSDDFADEDLIRELRNGRIRSKCRRTHSLIIAYKGMGPLAPEQTLLSEAFWRDREFESLSIGVFVVPSPRKPMSPVQLHSFAYFVWKPDCEKIFGAVAMPSEPEPQAQEVPERRGKKPVHDRADLQSAALGLALQRKQGAPQKKPSDVVNELREWCKQNKRKVPSPSTLYEIVAAAFLIKWTLKS